MTVVWSAFIGAAILVAGIAFALARYGGQHALAVRKCVGFLTVLAIGTAAFPIFLPGAGVVWWVVGYISFVALLVGNYGCGVRDGYRGFQRLFKRFTPDSLGCGIDVAVPGLRRTLAK